MRWFGIFDWPMRNYAPETIECTLDLGKIRNLETVAVQMWDDAADAPPNDWSVKRPLAATVSLSLDGRQWGPAQLFQSPPETIRVKGKQRSIWLRRRVDGKGHFLKLRFEPKGNNLALGEIQVINEDENIALGKSYTLHPRPTGDGTLVDNFGKLTNGFLTAQGAISQWDPVADFVALSPTAATTIQLDLNAVYPIKGARAHLLGSPRDQEGANFPKQLTVQTSVDRITWTDAGHLSLPW